MIAAAALLFVLAAGPPARALAEASAAQSRVAVMPPVAPPNVDVSGAQAAMRKATATVDRVKALEPAALARLIASASESGISCDAGLADCATRIGAFGGLDFVVVTRVESAPPRAPARATQTRATLALHDCADGREVRKASALLGDDVDARNQGLAALALAVLGEGEVRGRLEVIAPADGVVVVDGVDRGQAPLVVALPAGVHDVAWRSARGELMTTTIEIPAAATVSATFASEAIAADWTTSTLALVGGGALAFGALVALGGSVGAWAVAPPEDARARYSASGYNDAVGLGRVLLGAGIGGAALAAAGAVALVIASNDDGVSE